MLKLDIFLLPLFLMVPGITKVDAQCSAYDQDILLNPGTWSATANGGTGSPSLIINNNVVTGISWRSNGINQYVQIDYGSDLDLAGLVYYPDTINPNTVTEYFVEVSTDNVDWTTVISSGTMPPPIGSRGIPVNVNFLDVYNARYLRFIVANSGESIAELLPVVCNSSNAYPVINCGNAWMFNSGAATATSKKGSSALDSNWEVAYITDPAGTLPDNKWTTSSPYDYSSTAALSFYPAIAVNTSVAWNTPVPNHYTWIGATQSREDVLYNTSGAYPGGGDQNTYFYRYRFSIDDPYFADNLRIKFNMWADNTVVRVFVNGADQNITPGGEYDIAEKYIEMTEGFHLGVNEIMIQSYSEPSLQGILIRNMTWCLGNDFGDAPETYATATAPSHIIELNYERTVQLLKMGAANTDAESSGTASADAKADDTTGTDDEGGVVSFPSISSNNVDSYSVDVTATNNSGRDAYIVGWIDWNQNGAFESGEKAVSPVIATGSNNVARTLTWASQVFADVTDFAFARFRISSDDDFNTSASADSYAKDGEMEDYYFLIKGCIKPGTAGTPDGFAKVGILTKAASTVANWPESVPDGYLVMDAASKGFVITHMTTAQRNNLTPVDGMLIYNTTENCVQLYRGTAPGVDNTRTGWNCIERACNE